MKKIIPAILACALAAVSCVKEKPQDSTALARPGNYFETTLSATELSAEEGEVALTISSNVLWNLDLGDGLYTYDKNGIGNAVLHVSVPANLSFKSRTFALSVSTDAELDDAKTWSAKGKTDSYVIKQQGVPMLFAVDTNKAEVSSIATSAEFLLSENVGYKIDSLSANLTYSVENLTDNLHKITFSFPKNVEETAKTYYAKIFPVEGADSLTPISIRIDQAEFVKIFQLDTNAAKLVCLDTLVTVVLTENVGYECACEPSTVKCTAEDISEGVHKLKISFPENTDTTKQTYTVTITPKDVPSTLSPITVTVTHCENVPLELDCSNASKFRYNNGSSVVALPARGSGPTTPYDFWLDGNEQYKFYGAGRNWSSCLNAVSPNLDIKLPSISGYELRKVDFIYSNPSSNRTYKIVDQNGSELCSAVLNKGTGAGVKTIPANNSTEVHLTCNSEMALKFKLYYYPNN